MSVVITKSLKKSAFLNNSSNTRINKAEPAKVAAKCFPFISLICKNASYAIVTIRKM